MQPYSITIWRANWGVGAYRYTPGGRGRARAGVRGVRRPVGISGANAGRIAIRPYTPPIH